MAYQPVANLRPVRVSQLTDPCPESAGRTRTRQPTARLDRWQILRDLLVDAWANPDEPSDTVLSRHVDALSVLEADLVRRMFTNVMKIFPIPETAGLDLEGRRFRFDSEEEGITIGVSVTFSVEESDGRVEHVRLKTGRSPTTSEEAAVLWSEAEEGESFVDLMAWAGEVEQVSPPPDVEAVLARLVEAAPQVQRSGVRPGPGCVWCSRSALCGAYPADRVVPASAYTVNLTKTDVEILGACERRVAWRRVHGVPRDDGEEGETQERVAQGRLFHAMVASAEGSDDPDGHVETFLAGVPPSEVAELRMMWDHHRRLIDDEGLQPRQSEFPVGTTLLEGEGAGIRGVTVIAFLDLTARDREGHPVAIELKTGSPGDTEVEDDLYAVGMHRWIPRDHPVTIHRHFVRFDPPECEVVTVGPDDLGAARDRLRRRVQPVHGWDWEDPLQPAYVPGSWCGSCEFRVTCGSYR